MAEALKAVEAAEDGWLPLPARRRLRAAYGPWTPPDAPGGPDAGLLRRAALQALAVRRALPRWDAAFPEDRRPHALVDRVADALAGRGTWAQADALAEELRRTLERLGAEGPLHAFAAGSAALAHAYEARDGDLDEALDPPDRQDTDLDEPPAEAFAAHALGFEDPGAYREFWRWYVVDAFPTAYRAAP
jgi:hypothetical protein